MFAPNLSWNDIENEDNFHEAYSNFFPSDNNLPLNNALISDTKLQFDGNHAETFENNSLLPLEQTSAAETNSSFFDDSIPDDFFLQFLTPPELVVKQNIVHNQPQPQQYAQTNTAMTFSANVGRFCTFMEDI